MAAVSGGRTYTGTTPVASAASRVRPAQAARVTKASRAVDSLVHKLR